MYEMFIEGSGDNDTCAFDVNDFDMSVFDLLAEEHDLSQAAARTSGEGSGSKIVVKKAAQSKKVSPYRKGTTVRQVLAEGVRKPNMSRRSPTNVLVAFPAFDRCDSLVFFPSTFTRLANSDDLTGIKKLFTNYMHKDCVFKYHANTGNVMVFDQSGFLQMFNVSSVLEPDRIACVRSTKVVENTIRATLYIKLTDNQQLYDLVLQTSPITDPNVAALCQVDRSARLKYYIHDELLSDPVKQEIVNHAGSTEDLLLYVQCDIVLTIDDMTKKVTCFDMTYLVTSIHPVGIHQQIN